MININDNEIDGVYIGDTSPSIYLGNELIYGDLVTITIKTNGFGYIKYKNKLLQNNDTIKVKRNSSIILTLIPNENDGINYGEWQNNNETMISTDVERTITPAEDINVYAWFGLESFTIDDTWLYDDMRYVIYQNGIPIRRVIYNRNIPANRTLTVALPFDFDFDKQDFNREIFYKMKELKYDGSSFKIWYNNPSNIKANLPYILQSTTALNGLTINYAICRGRQFKYIICKNIVTDYGYDVIFINTIFRQKLLESKNLFYITNNQFYYPNGDVWNNAFRGYFFDMKYISELQEDLAQYEGYSGFPSSPSEY